eukprot:TRINITY_DN28337_c0_g1_i1.p1 TRINITY_DN28337_c0_g1~~TRINITY_DN28337_c0_g1_i1.p1  ORF type:complete len:467 (+),score=88.25 TRINITY_DN28337_c0_g1_i1:40-1401(+)
MLLVVKLALACSAVLASHEACHEASSMLQVTLPGGVNGTRQPRASSTPREKPFERLSGQLAALCSTPMQALALLQGKAVATLGTVTRSKFQFGGCKEDRPGYLCVPHSLWMLSLWVLATLAFYTTNYVLWLRSKVFGRTTNLADIKHNSEHGNLLGSVVEEAIKYIDTQTIGVKLDFGTMMVKMSTGVIEFSDFTVNNPGRSYWSDHFVHVGHFLLEVDMVTLVESFGQKIVVQRIEFEDVSVIWERALFTSNLNDIMNLFKQKASKSEPASSKAAPKASKSSGRSVEVLEVDISNVSLKVAFHKLAGIGPRVAVSDLHSDNLSRQMGSGNEAENIMPFVAKSLVDTILGNLIGLEATRDMFEGDSSIFRIVAGSFWHLVTGIWLLLKLCCMPGAAPSKQGERKEKAPKAVPSTLRMQVTAALKKASDTLKKTACHAKEDQATAHRQTPAQAA